MEEACLRASLYLDPKKKEYLKTVEKEDLSIYKGRHMTEMNKSKKKWLARYMIIEEFRKLVNNLTSL